jgi:hypothetical protein
MRQLIRIGKNIINVAHVRRIEIGGPEVVNVYLGTENEPLQFIEEEARVLLATLGPEYVTHVKTEAELKAEGLDHFEQLKDLLESSSPH